MTLDAALAAGLFFGLIGLIGVLAARGPSDVVTLFLLVFGLFYGFRALLIITGLDAPFPEDFFVSTDTAAVYTKTLLGLSGYLLFALLGMQVVLRSRVRGWAPFFVTREISVPRAVRVTVILTILATLISAYLVATFGGIGNLITEAKFEKSLAGLYFLRVAPAVGAVVAAATFLDARRRGARYAARLSFLCAVANATYVFLWGSRSLLVVVGAIIVLGLRRRERRTPDAQHPRYHRPRIALRIAIAILLVIAVAGGLRMARDTLMHGEVQEVYGEASTARQMSLGTNAVYFDAAMLSFRDWPDSYAYRDGQDFVDGALGIVPRIAWEDKPDTIAPGRWFRQVYEPRKINGWPMGAAALWYLNFGWPGLFIGGLLSGLAIGILAAAQRRRPPNGFNTAAAVVIGVFVVGLGWDSDLLVRCVIWLVPLWLIARYVAPTPRSRAHSHPETPRIDALR